MLRRMISHIIMITAWTSAALGYAFGAAVLTLTSQCPEESRVNRGHQ